MNAKKHILPRRKRPRIHVGSELQFLRECERDCYTSIGGKGRFIELLRVIHLIPEPESILDVGGSLATGRWFQAKFPRAKVTLLNTSRRELGSYPHVLEADAQCFKTQEKYDLVFAGDIIEHMYNPDGLVCSCLLAMKPSGHFAITSPNLSCIYNRLFLLFGWSLGNYFPSLRFKAGNPFLPETGGDFGPVPDHKSVFTWKGLYQLLMCYGFKIISARGYDYTQHEKARLPANKCYNVPARKIRLVLSRLLPKGLQEGMLFLCEAPEKMDANELSKGILKDNLWTL